MQSFLVSSCLIVKHIIVFIRQFGFHHFSFDFWIEKLTYQSKAGIIIIIMAPKGKVQAVQVQANTTNKKKKKTNGKTKSTADVVAVRVVEKDPAAQAKILAEMDDATGEQYYDDKAFQKAYGPSIWMYGEEKLDESIIGLTMQLDYGSYGK
jgi:hypothetical protein